MELLKKVPPNNLTYSCGPVGYALPGLIRNALALPRLLPHNFRNYGNDLRITVDEAENLGFRKSGARYGTAHGCNAQSRVGGRPAVVVYWPSVYNLGVSIPILHRSIVSRLAAVGLSD